MPDQNLSQELEILEKRIQEIKKGIERSGIEMPSNKEIVAQAVGERMEENMKLAPAAVPPPVTPQQAQAVAQVRSSASSDHDEAEEVKIFVDVAFEKNIPAAVDIVRKTGNAHLLDAFHDVLVDKFYEELVRRGKLEQF